MWIFNFRIIIIEQQISTSGKFQTALAQFLEGIGTIQRYHEDRADVLVLSAKSGRNLRFQWRFRFQWRYGNFQTSLAQFLEGVRTNQRYHDDRTDVLVLSAKSDRNLIFRIWDFNEDFESEISMKILKCCFFSKEFQQKLKQNPIFKNTELFWRKIPFYRKSHFTWRNLVRFGKPIIPFYRDPILSGMYCTLQVPSNCK